VRLAAALFVLAWPTVAAAQQPFSTDDADVTPRGTVHIEAFNEYDWLQPSQAPHRRQNTFNMRVNYGVGRGLELDLDSPLIAISNDAQTAPRRPFGIGDTNFGVKYNIRGEREGSSLPAFTAAAYIETPTGDVTTGLGSGLTDVWVYGVVQKSMRKGFVLRLNGGYLVTGNTSTGVVGITTARGKVTTMGGSLVRKLTDALRLGGEVSAAAATDASLNRGQLQALVGGNYALREKLTLDFGLIAGHFTASPRVGVQIGFSLDVP
jgi:hypothetical protein